ncbi:hypothetical protein V499_01507, partial [Pseudogymnoascus sp. VKM F-103]
PARCGFHTSQNCLILIPASLRSLISTASPTRRTRPQ